MQILQTLAQEIGQSIKVVDLTHTLNEDFPGLQLPPEFGQVGVFKKEQICRYDEKGPAWYWNNFSCGEHFGTHFDAPQHWISGKDYAEGTVDKIDPAHFIAPACVIDASKQSAEDPDFILTPAFIEAWESEHGVIESGSWVILRTDWSKRAMPDDFVNIGDDGLPHTPGPSKEAVELLIARDVLGFGVETINTDAGQSFIWEFQLPCHTLMHGAGKYGLQCLCNLEQLPAKGVLILAPPLKIEGGSGSPTRILALVQS